MLTKKDTILIGVLINSALLAVLFITAIVYDVDITVEEEKNAFQIADAKELTSTPIPETPIQPAVPVPTTGDEVDNILNYYATTNEEELPALVQPKEFEPPATNDAPSAAKSGTSSEMVEITVKRGDSLDKIAKANGTSVSAIKKANQLSNEKLSIGQILKVPVKKKSTSASNSTVVSNTTPSSSNTEAQYYVIKSGDNPWKISKQFNVKYEDILRLNNLDEDKARNMKAGDRIRIK